MKPSIFGLISYSKSNSNIHGLNKKQITEMLSLATKESIFHRGLHIWAGEWRISSELLHLQSTNLPEVYNVMIIPHQTKVQRLIKRGHGTSCEMVLLRLSVISVAYSAL